MLEGVLEQLLLQYLAPYVDGITRDKLHFGVVSGALELKDLSVQPDALATLGCEGFRVRRGSIGTIKLCVPWRKLYSGKLQASVENVHLEIESIAADFTEENAAQLITEIRQAKRKAIDVRMHQLADLLQQQGEAQEGDTKRKGLGVKLARKILYNIRIDLTTVSVQFIAEHRGFACALQFPALSVLSTDETFDERADRQEAVVAGNSMYKLLRLEDLSIRMSPAGSADLDDAEFVVSPICASMKVAHLPIESILHLRLEVATQLQPAELILRRSQVKHVRGLRTEITLENQRLFELIVPPVEERMIFTDPKQSRDEYSRLYERYLRWDWMTSGEASDFIGDIDKLIEKEERYMQLLEDAFSTRVLARARLQVRNKLEAVNQVVARRLLEAEKARWEEERKKQSFWDRFRRKSQLDDAPSAEGEKNDGILKPEERDQLVEDFSDESKFESVDLPQCFKIEFVMGKMQLDLVDDRWQQEEAKQQLLSLALQDAHWTINVGMATDHRGQDSAEWRMELGVTSFQAFHRTQAFLTFLPQNRLVDDNDWQIIDEASNRAALLVVDNKLEEDMNLMKVTVEVAPVEVHMLPGVAELVVDFWRNPNPAAAQQAGGSQQAMDDADLRFEDFKEITKQYLQANSEKAKKVAEQVYERIPDRIQFQVSVASPILHVPVIGLGTAVASLGRLSITTPPSAYDSIDMEWLLDQTSVVAKSCHGERVDMIQPVPVRLTLQYRALEDENQINLQIRAKECVVALSPQAVQILLCTPGALLAILYPEDDVAKQIAPEAADTSKKSRSGSKATSGRAVSKESGGSHAETRTIARRASILAQEVLGNEGENILQAAARKVEQVRRKQFRLDMGVRWDALAVTLADSIVPVVKMRMELMDPGVVMYQQSIPYAMRMNMANCMLEVDVLNPRNGHWEPLAEPFHLGIGIDRKQANEDQRSTHVVVSGHEPLLLNFTPTTLRRAGYIIPLFAKSMTFTLPEEDLANVAVFSGTKYRVVNLCEEPIELLFTSAHREGLRTTIQPTGSSWEPLDEWILPHFVTGISARAQGTGERFSDMLLLERIGAVIVPDSGYVAELLTPDPSHRLLLLATPVRVHNRTDIPVQVRFHDEALQEVLPLDLPPTLACDAAFIGHAAPNCTVRSHFGELAQPCAHTGEDAHSSLELEPNAVCAVPASALIREGGRAISTAHCWISLRPVGVSVQFSKPQRAGARIDSCMLTCRSNSRALAGRGVTIGGVGGAGDVNFLCSSEAVAHGLPAPCMLTNVILQPTLALLNALPIGKLDVRYAQRGPSESGWARWREVNVPSFTRLNIYNFSGELKDGMGMQARFNSEAPWSAEVVLNEHGMQEADSTKTLNLRQSREGGASGITVEPLNNVEVRISCANWFIDRSGIPRPPYLEVRCWGDRLPHESEITLLPVDVLEESCDLVLCAAGRNRKIISSKSVRLPPSWTVFPWRTGPGSHWVFCVQVEDIKASDVFGAKCQVMVLKPRVVLTNSSKHDLEVQFSQTRKIRLAAGQSKEHHWKVDSGEEEQLSANLRFRPAREKGQPQCDWSGMVICNDGSAGSTPFALTRLPEDVPDSDTEYTSRSSNQSGDASPGAASKGRPKSGIMKAPARSLGVEVWSVEVAPVRGALAVTFREGSDFVAVNNCTRTPVQMSLRPHGCDDAVANVDVPLGKEVEYGFMRPFYKDRRRSVDIVANNTRIHIEDVRRTVRRISRQKELMIVVSRVGTKTVLTLQEFEPTGSGQRGSVQVRTAAVQPCTAMEPAVVAAPAVLLQCDVKISRIGISLVEEAAIPRELLYLHLELIRFTFEKQEDDVRSFRLAISEAQVDCQLPGRVDANTTDRRRGESLALLNRERPAVILANCADGDRAFLTFFLQRGATSSRDIILHRVDIDFDALDITIDDVWLDPLVAWIDQTKPEQVEERGMPFKQILETAGRSSLEDYVAPALPFVVQVDQMSIGAVNLTVWTWLKLKSVRFLPQYVRTAIRVLSFSGQFTLDGASLFLPQRVFPPHRGSLRDFLKGLVNEYTMNLINNLASILGKSSVLNLPRAPLRFGGTVFSYLTDSLGLAAGEASSIMAQLTFDDDYIVRQRVIRESKRIKGLSDGVVEAGKSLAEGIEGVADLWKKPQEGHKQGGMVGLMSGLGQGLVSSFVKPVAKLGQAISDVGTGIAAQVTPDTASMKRRRARLRQRPPRLLFSQLGAIRPWCDLEAEVLQQLGPQLCSGVEEVLALQGNGSVGWTVLLLFPQHFLIVKLKSVQSGSTTVATRESRRGSSSSSTADPETKAQRVDLFEALDESAIKLFSQAAKPINTLVYGVQDMEAQRLGGYPQEEGPGPADQELWERARNFEFRDLRAVHTSGPDNALLQLEDMKGGIHNLPLRDTPFGVEVRQGLVGGFQSSLTNQNRIANWDNLRKALLVEAREHRRRNRAESATVRCHIKGVGERVLEVFEVERRYLTTGEWKTPFLPIDKELGHRWVDATGTRHPHLIRSYTLEQCAAATSPPCELDVLFRPIDGWCIHKGKDTDEDGWKYGMAWVSSTWDTHPGLFDAIRKRRWTRRYE